MIRIGEREAELAGELKWVGGKVVVDAMKARPGRDGRDGRVISVLGRRWSRRSSRKSGWVEDNRAVRRLFRVGSINLCGHKLHMQPLREKNLSAL